MQNINNTSNKEISGSDAESGFTLIEVMVVVVILGIMFMFGRIIPKDLALWKKVGNVGKLVGLEWAGEWKKFKEFPHFQYTGGLSIFDFQNGKTF